MFAGSVARVLLGLTFCVAVATSALAAPVTFSFVFTDGTARAAGTITLESTLVNPGVGNYALPNPAVLALQVTVTGATAGNGTFGIGSFSSVIFDTAGSTLDFSRELVGQTAGAGLWGTTSRRLQHVRYRFASPCRRLFPSPSALTTERPIPCCLPA